MPGSVLSEHDFISPSERPLAFARYPHAVTVMHRTKPHGEAAAHTGLGPVSALRCKNRSVSLANSPDTSTSTTLGRPVGLRRGGRVNAVGDTSRVSRVICTHIFSDKERAWPDVKTTLLTSSHPQGLTSLKSHNPLEDPISK